MPKISHVPVLVEQRTLTDEKGQFRGRIERLTILGELELEDERWG